MTDLFNKGCLVQLETSAWTARVKIPSKQLLNGDHADVDPTYVGASKRLVSGDALRTVEALRSEARAWLYSQSLPFPLEGAVFVPATEIERIDRKLSEYRERYEEAARTFAEIYPTLRESARKQLGSLYSTTDYPAKVSEKFSFSWRFLSLAPAGETQLLSAALVEQERHKFQQLMAQAAESAVGELRQRFAEVVDHVVDRLSGEQDGKPKIFRDSIVGNLREFFDDFKRLNVLDDRALAELVDRARETIDGVEAKDLRKDDDLRAHVAGRMTELQGALDAMVVNRPTRKVRLVPKVEINESVNQQ